MSFLNITTRQLHCHGGMNPFKLLPFFFSAKIFWYFLFSSRSWRKSLKMLSKIFVTLETKLAAFSKCGKHISFGKRKVISSVKWCRNEVGAEPSRNIFQHYFAHLTPFLVEHYTLAQENFISLGKEKRTVDLHSSFQRFKIIH